MRAERIWPNGLRYLWTDAFGVVLLVSLHRALGDVAYLSEAKALVAEVDRVLGRARGIRIGEEPDRDGQCFHDLAIWLYTLHVLGRIELAYRQKAIALVRAIHPRLVVPGVGVLWKMQEDLSGPFPGYGIGALDAFHGSIVYRLVDAQALASEIAALRPLVEQSYPSLEVTQDLGLGMILWMSQFFPEEHWARTLRLRAFATLDRMWIDPPGYFSREPRLPRVKFAFTNYGISIGLQAVGAHPERVAKLNPFFAGYRSHDEYDRNAITHVMGCGSLFPGEFLDARAAGASSHGCAGL
jgi:hypothetical protein